MKFRKKPVVIEAMQYYAGMPVIYFPTWLMMAIESDNATIVPEGMVIKTLEGDHMAQSGDWIIQGVKGELYPCKPDIFEMTYDAVEGEV